jgi:hypothetical protein
MVQPIIAVPRPSVYLTFANLFGSIRRTPVSCRIRRIMQITKFLKAVRLLTLLILSLAMPLASSGQTYYLSTPITGGITIPATDYGDDWDVSNGDVSGSLTLTFTNLSEMVYLDLVNQTIRQVGTIYFTSPAPYLMLQETQATIVSIDGRSPTRTNVFGTVKLVLNWSWHPATESSCSIQALRLCGQGASFGTGTRVTTRSPVGLTFHLTRGAIPSQPTARL